MLEMHTGMKRTILLFSMAIAAAASAQTAPKAAAPAAKATTTTHATATTASAAKLPPGIRPVRGLMKTAFSLRYQDIKIGTGALAEPNKMYKVFYTGWLASDGHKFDSTDDHPRPPKMDKDGKPVMGADGKPEQGDIQPISFPQGFGRVIPGWDQGFEGMHIGGKRRLFIPWQLAYGARGRPGPDAAHPGIPAKADLIFDVELVGVEEMPAPPAGRPGMGGMPGRAMPPRPGAAPGTPVTPGAPGTPASPATPGRPGTPATPPSAGTPGTPATPPSTQAPPPPPPPPPTTPPPAK